LKSLNKLIALTAVLIFISATNILSNISNPDDSLAALTQYSLFSEYHKNKDYSSALPYGWKVIEMDPKRFAKWVYYKMEDVLWYLHDSSNTITDDEIKAIEDTIIYVYNLAIEHYPEQRGYFQVRKAFVSETWLEMDPETVIKEYETAFGYDPNLSTYYYDRLGELYKANANETNEYITKASDIYSYLSDLEPENEIWPRKLVDLVDDPIELVRLFRDMWEKDKENPEKAWKYAQAALRENMNREAIEPLEFLASKNPESSSYLDRLATAYHKTDQLDKAVSTYRKLTQLEPDKKENYLNLGIIAKDKGQLSAARTHFEKASSVGNGWGLPIYYVGNLYEQAARSCGFEFEDKLVYQLAVDTYRRARNMDPSLTQAQERISALSSSLPTQEDYFFRGYKSGQVIQINGRCYNWIGKSVTVP
jgi:tetratricopeptide (TPR) repeat protein